MLKKSLRTPGPAELPWEILQAAGTQMVAPRGDEVFAQTLKEVVAWAQEVFETKNEILLFSATGTGGMESSIANTISPGDKILVCVNGEFGARFAIIAGNFGAQIEKIEDAWGEPLDVAKVQKRLAEDKGREIKAVLVIHNETSTGILNPIDELGEVVAKHGALLIVDGVSSIGSTEFCADRWHVDIGITASQKGLMCPPGLNVISVSEKAWKAVEKAKSPRYYWDYRLARGLLGKTLGLPDSQLPGIPITPSISLIFTLHKALEMLRREGLDNVYKRHRSVARAMRAGAKEIGLKLIAPESCASPTVTVISLPESLSGDEARNFLHQRFNVDVARGHKKFSNNVIRVGHLGYVDLPDIITVLAGLEALLYEMELMPKTLLGKGVAAAQVAYFHE